MKRIMVSEIDWETDGADVELPDSVVMEVNDDEDCDTVVDRLSDEYGYLIEGVRITKLKRI